MLTFIPWAGRVLLEHGNHGVGTKRIGLNVGWIIISKFEPFKEAWVAAGTIPILERLCEEGEMDDNFLRTALARLKGFWIMSQPWSVANHAAFPPSCSANVFCILLAAGRCMPTLPSDLWTEEILSKLSFSDFP